MTDRRSMGWWRLFLDSLDSNGGHIFLLFLMIVGCFWGLFYEPTAMKAGELLSLASGALLMMLKTVGSNRDQQGDSTTTAVVTTSTSPVTTVTNDTNPTVTTGA